MSGRTSREDRRARLADTVRRLLEEKYGPGRVPGVRAISADIRAANGGETVSHGHIHNILKGEADNLTDRTRRLLATFFGCQIGDLLLPDGSDEQTRFPDRIRPSARTVQALAGRFATFAPEQLAAIQQAVEIVTAQQEDQDQ